ncbi:hypothetical protein RSOL_196110, partial [Rhizoctonia solani AG-3 Rhs1AP]
MPPARFRPNEQTFFEQRIPLWEKIKSGPGSQRSKSTRRERNEFIQRTCKDFYVSFPERDPTIGDPTPLTFSKDVVDDFEEIVRQWYRNRTRGIAPAPRGTVESKDKRISARNLVMKRNAQAISELARDIMLEQPELNSMSAFNKATTRFIDTMKQDDPSAYEKLVADAAEIRQASHTDFTDLSPDTLAQLLEEFPDKMNDELERHARELPVHIWSVVSYATPPSQEMKTYTMYTPSLRGMSNSENHSAMISNFKAWMKEHLGTTAALQMDTAEPLVYPDLKNHMRPALPVPLDVESLSTLQLRTLLRIYLNYTSQRHARELPVHIWSVVSYATPPSQEMKTYTMYTPSLRGMSNSENHSAMISNFKAWMKEHLGTTAALQMDTAEPLVYPDLKNHMRPALPVPLDVESLSTLQLRTLLRIYLNYTSRWQGHRTGVPWGLMAKDNRFHYIRQSCFPPGVNCLKKVNDMKRDELLVWYRWILDGQEHRLQPDQRFQFARLPQPDGEVVLEFPDPIITRPSTSNLTWTPEEKLYARKVHKLAEDALSDPSWNGLPLARLQEIYQPFSASMKTAMSAGCSIEYQSAAITSLVFDIERYGPVHTRDLTNREPLIAYIGEEPNNGTLSALLLTRTLEVAALLADHPDHPDYSIPSVIRWAKTNTRLRHEQSGTWRGGPDGVRAMVAVYIHIANAFSMYAHCSHKLPTSLVKAFDCCNFDRLQTQLVAFGAWILQSLQDTITKLKITYAARAQAWKHAVVGQYLERTTRHTADESLRRDTNSIPRSMNTLARCYEELQETSPDITLGQNNMEFRPVRRPRRTRVKTIEEELSDRDSTSAEEIIFPESDEWNESDEKYKSHIKQRMLDSPSDNAPHLGLNNLTVIARLDNSGRQHAPSPRRSPEPKEVRSPSRSGSEVQSEKELHSTARRGQQRRGQPNKHYFDRYIADKATNGPPSDEDGSRYSDSPQTLYGKSSGVQHSCVNNSA